MGVWKQIAALPNPRANAAACFHDDKTYVFGGVASAGGFFIIYQSTTYIYDPDTNTWSTGAAMPATGFCVAFSTAADGIHLIFPSTGAHYAYDPDANTWATRQAVPTTGRASAHHFTDSDGLIYLAGGRTSGGGTVATVNRYDPDTNSWTSRADMPAPVAARHPLSSPGVLGGDDNVYLGYGGAAGGLIVYDPHTDIWSTTSNMPDAPNGLASPVSRLPSGVVLALPHSSWSVPEDGSAGLLHRVDGYDPDTSSWTMGVIPDHPGSNYSTAVATEPGGAVYLLGGVATTYAVVTAECWSYTQNEAPTAPTPRTMVGGVTISTEATNRAAWTFNDPNVGDSQSKFNLYYRPVGDTSWTTVTKTTPNPWYDFTAGTLTADDYEWQLEAYDAAGVISPRTASAFFTAADPPDGPSISYPINGQSVEQFETVAWSAAAQDSYQLRRVADDAGEPDTEVVYFDTAEVVDTLTRFLAVEFETNDRTEHVQVRVKDGGLWSDWVDVLVEVSYTPPPAPTFETYPDEATGSLLLMITTPDPEGDAPSAAYVDVYIDDGAGEVRKATLLPISTSWRYWTPISGRDYTGRIRVVAVAANGTTASSS